MIGHLFTWGLYLDYWVPIWVRVAFHLVRQPLVFHNTPKAFASKQPPLLNVGYALMVVLSVKSAVARSGRQSGF